MAAKTTRLEKIKWLLTNQNLWEGYPNEEYKGIRYDSRILPLSKQMQEAGLFSKKTYLLDISHSVIKLIAEARTYRRNLLVK